MTESSFAVYKYPVDPLSSQRIELPLGAQVLSVAFQSYQPVLYALVDVNEKRKQRYILTMYGTGECIPNTDPVTSPYTKHAVTFLGTINFESMWVHVFIRKEGKISV